MIEFLSNRDYELIMELQINFTFSVNLYNVGFPFVFGWFRALKRFTKIKDSVNCHISDIRQKAVLIQRDYHIQLTKERSERIQGVELLHDKIVGEIMTIKARLYEIERLEKKNKKFFDCVDNFVMEIRAISDNVDELEENCNRETQFNNNLDTIIGACTHIKRNLDEV